MTELSYRTFVLHLAQEKECIGIKHECKKWPLNAIQKSIVTSSRTFYYLESWILVPPSNLFITISEARRRPGISANPFKKLWAPVTVISLISMFYGRKFPYKYITQLVYLDA